MGELCFYVVNKLYVYVVASVRGQKQISMRMVIKESNQRSCIKFMQNSHLQFINEMTVIKQ